MATRNNATTNLQSTTAGLVSWAGEIQTLLTSAGWAQTADTGQTAAASLVSPGSANAVAGYQIWQMQDALQVAGSKVYVKFEFGEGVSTTAPGLWITIGTGSDGSGNITGTIYARTQLWGAASGYVTSAPTWGSGSTDRIVWGGGTTLHLFFGIERTKDGAGNDTTDGILFFAEQAATAPISVKAFQYLRFTNNTLPNLTQLGAFAPSGTTWADGTTVGVCPVRYHNGGPSNPGLNLMVYMNGDTPAGTSVSITEYGSSHVFMPIGTTVLSTTVPGQANASLMIRYE